MAVPQVACGEVDVCQCDSCVVAMVTGMDMINESVEWQYLWCLRRSGCLTV